MKLIIKQYIPIIALLMQFAVVRTQTDLKISEILASNVTGKYNTDYYNFGDWIEIYNNSSTGINLQGYYLTDDPDSLFKYEIFYYFYFNPGDSKIIWADKYDGFMHTNFSLDSDGEFLALVDPSGKIVDSVVFGPQYPDISYGRRNNNDSTWQYFSNPTPGQNNGTGFAEDNFSARINFSLSAGFYQGSQVVELTCDSAVNSIRYTLDGKFPSKNSPLYTGPVNVTKNTIIRARSYTDGKLPSPIESNSYFINEESPTLPVVSISTDSKYFFDWIIGIYVVGTNGISGNCIDTLVNFNQDWERPVNFEYFLPDGDQVINQQVGVKINGGCSRHVPLKSLAVYAREKYGKSDLDFAFFNNKSIDSYHNLILRNTGNDYYFCYIRDGFMQSIIADVTDIDYQSYQPARIYLNGEYWGILNVREKQNEHYLASNFGVNPDRVDLLESNQEIIEGDDIHYQNMMDFLRSNDITQPENYEYLNTQMDVNQFIDYYSAQVFYENEDWPQHNIKFWRPRTNEGRWRWLLYDTDYGFGRWPRTGNTVKWAFREDDWSTELGSIIIKNEDFRNEFIQRFAVRLNTTFAPERVIHILDSLVGNIDAEMHLHIARWGSPYSHEHWLDNIQGLREFAINRVPLLFNQFDDYFNLDGTANLNVRKVNPTYGQVMLHDIPISDSISVELYRNIPVRLRAKPKPGYQFSHWEGASNSSSDTIIIYLDESDSIVAHFKVAEPITSIFINELSSKPVNGIPDEYGQPEDWIELYNTDSSPVILDGLYFTDSIEDPFKYKIQSSTADPIQIPAQEYIVFYADNDEEQGDRHLNFKLSNEGELIALVQKVGDTYVILDSISYSKQYEKLSFGRFPDGLNTWQLLCPTPGISNQETSVSGIVINEFMAANQSVITDEYGEFDDWIEIFNASDTPVNIAGLFITDSLTNKTRYRLPLTDTDSLLIQPNDHLLLWADNQPEQGISHLGFKLGSDGESIGLIQQNGIDFIDLLEYPDISADVAMGRLPDGSPGFHITTPTPGTTNKLDTIVKLYINEFCAANNSMITDEFGEYNDWIEIYNANYFPVNIGGLYITDNQAQPANYKIPSNAPDSTIIPARGFILLWADNQPEQGILHLDFKLSSEGESIGLVQYNGMDFIDYLEYPGIQKDVSMGRIPDGSSEFQLTAPTPGSGNKIDTVRNIYINEFCSSNRSIISDEFGEYNDWIEIYNDNDFSLDIGGLYITDTLKNPAFYRIPSYFPDSTTIPAKDFILFWADNQPEQGIRHLGFKLSNDGEQIGLSLADGKTYIDSITYDQSEADISTGRYPDGSTNIHRLIPTPGNSNFVSTIKNVFITEISASNQSYYTDEYGEYNDWIELYNNNDYPVDIGGTYITDSLNHKTKHRIPDYYPDSTTIPANGRLILWADNEPWQGILHLDFRLSGAGEQVGLINWDGISFIDSVTFPDQFANYSYGKLEDTSEWILIRPSPMEPNYKDIVEGIFINEFMADNSNRYMDEFGEYDDWIEFYNANSYPVDIGGFYLTDSLNNPGKYRIPSNQPENTTILPNEYLIVFTDNSSEQGPLHTNFKLSRNGEDIGLFHSDANQVIDWITYDKQYQNFAYAKLEEENRWYSVPPTPGMKNTIPDLSSLYINEFMPDNDDVITDNYGEYDDWIELYNGGEFPIDIGGLFFSDSLNDKTKHRIPTTDPDSTTIQPGSYMILWSDNDEEQGILHLSFKLSKEQEEIGIFNYKMELIDTVSYMGNHSGSYGRRSDGFEKWLWMNPPTPGISNTINPVVEAYISTPDILVFPNPMDEVINFIISVTDAETVTLKIFSQTGDLISNQQKSIQNAEKIHFEWNAEDSGGYQINSGIFVYQIILNEQVITGHFIKL